MHPAKSNREPWILANDDEEEGTDKGSTIDTPLNNLKESPPLCRSYTGLCDHLKPPVFDVGYRFNLHGNDFFDVDYRFNIHGNDFLVERLQFGAPRLWPSRAWAAYVQRLLLSDPDAPADQLLERRPLEVPNDDDMSQHVKV